MKYLPKNEGLLSDKFISNDERFVPINKRQFVSYHHDFPPNYIPIIRKGKMEFKWKNLSCQKDPMTLATYQQLFQKIKPKTILEFGTLEGGSGLWMNDILTCLGIETKIYTFDINNNNISIENSNITTITLDVYNIKEYVKNNFELFNSLLHPILVIDDCHTNIVELFSEIDTFLLPGEYLIIEDTHVKNNHEQMLDFLQNKNYLVDTYYCDFWGLNNSCNVNSYLIKS